MAVIQLGALVTSIAGSVGGTTFTRGRNTIRMANKSRGHKPTLSKNQDGLSVIQQAFNAWSNLTTENKQAWNTNAATFQHPNRFGVMVPYTGRELFTSLWVTCDFIGENPPAPTELDATVSVINFDVFSLSGAPSAQIEVTTTAEPCYFFVQAQRLRPSEIEKPHKRYKKLYSNFVEDNATFSIQTELENYIGRWYAGDRIQFWVTPVNSFGFRGLTKTQIVTAT